jgi:hypothetical protein
MRNWPLNFRFIVRVKNYLIMTYFQPLWAKIVQNLNYIPQKIDFKTNFEFLFDIRRRQRNSQQICMQRQWEKL